MYKFIFNPVIQDKFQLIPSAVYDLKDRLELSCLIKKEEKNRLNHLNMLSLK